MECAARQNRPFTFDTGEADILLVITYWPWPFPTFRASAVRILGTFHLNDACDW
jgi:hypothetical protein